MEAFIYGEMVDKLREFRTLNGGKKAKANPKLTAAKVALAKVEVDIEELVNSLAGANDMLISFANRKAEELSARKQALTKQVFDLSAAEIPAAKLTEISGYLDDWENTSFDDKRQVMNSLITVIRATSEHVEIEWEI